MVMSMKKFSIHVGDSPRTVVAICVTLTMQDRELHPTSGLYLGIKGPTRDFKSAI